MKFSDMSLCKLLNLKMPVFQAPMGGAVTPKFASCIANHGVLAMLPLGNWLIESCEKLIDETLALTEHTVGVNLILAWDQKERLALALKKGIKVIWFFWGDASQYIDEIHAHGAKVIVTVGKPDEAKKAVESGADIIVAQGWEAGGHIWGEVATLPLIPAVVDVVGDSVPVIAAGGIADGRGMAAALALGAQGIVLGTRLLASYEAGIHEQYKQSILNAKVNDTVFTDLFDKGWPESHMRVLLNSTYNMWLDANKPAFGERPGKSDIITEFSPDKPVERYSYYLPSPVMKGNLEPLAHYMGQSVGLIHEQKFVHEILDEVINDAIKRINQLQQIKV